MDNAEIDERWEKMKSEIRDLRSKSDLSSGLAAQVAQCEKARGLCGEIIATLELNFDRGEMHPEWGPHIRRWKKRLRKFGG